MILECLKASRPSIVLRDGRVCFGVWDSGWMTEPTAVVPDGFVRVQRRSPFLDLVGELYLCDGGDGPVYGLRIRSEHANNRGDAHGGVLMTVADLVLGYTTAFASDPPLPLTTASLNIDFVGSAKVGDWLEGRAEIVRTGRSLAFATCYLTVEERRIARASSVLAVGAAPLAGHTGR